MTDQREPESYETGYKRPPKKHRFKKGQSGNPKGRPRKARPQPETVTEILGRLLMEKVTLPNGEVVAALELHLRALLKAIIKKGDTKAYKELMAPAFLQSPDPIDYREEVRKKIEAIAAYRSGEDRKGTRAYQEADKDRPDEVA